MSRARSARGSDGLRSVEVLGWLLPVFGTEGENVAGGMLADADKHVAQVVEGVDAVQLAGGDQRVEDTRPLGSFVASSEEPVFASMPSSA